MLPDAAELDAATAAVEAARTTHQARMAIDYVTPDYHADRPKPCMNGWARRFIVISPRGKALPCHAAETILDLSFPDVRKVGLAEIWNSDSAFLRFRGTGWMPQPCRGCAFQEQDWGGCRCQALALTGDASAADPVCALSLHHQSLGDLISARPVVAPPFVFRRNAGYATRAQRERT